MDGKNDTLTRVHPESGLSVLGTNIPPLRSPFAISAVKPQLCLCFQFRLAEPSIYTGKQTALPLCHRRHALLHLVTLALYAHSLDCAPLSALQVLARLNCGHASASHKAPEAEGKPHHCCSEGTRRWKRSGRTGAGCATAASLESWRR
jgi:hypothetical protein